MRVAIDTIPVRLLYRDPIYLLMNHFHTWCAACIPFALRAIYISVVYLLKAALFDEVECLNFAERFLDCEELLQLTMNSTTFMLSDPKVY